MTTAATTADLARVLFVIDNDFGELHMALLMVQGLPLASRITLMLPPRLWALNGAGLPAHALPYGSLEDLLAAVDTARPDVVVLCTAYLLPFHQLITRDESERLVAALKARGCTVATSDPFWGLLATPHPRIAPPYGLLTTMTALARELVHIYPAPLEVEGIRCLSFFNPNIVDAPVAAVPQSFWRSAGVAESPMRKPFWLFPLTGEDYKMQTSLIGVDGIARRISAMFGDAHAAGRMPVLIAPEECLQAVNTRISHGGEAALLSYCEYSLFTSLLVHAEHVFYWNAGSTSCYLRIARGLSVFTFDHGHVATVVLGWLDRTSRAFFMGEHPPRLDPAKGLDPYLLAERASAYRPASERIKRNLERALTPQAMVSALLDGRE
jgi:hypothetical protein